jgi:phage-related protein
LLSEPYTKQIDGKLRELRFYLDGDALRITYWIASERRIVLLTVFQKSRMRETREIDRARRACQRCVREEHVVSAEEG